MATAKFIEKATKPIYEKGKVVEYVSKRGKRAGQTIRKIDRNQPQDENDKILINVGESYYTWCFYGGNPNYSKVCPRPSQLTNNWFKSELYSISEKVEDCECQDPDSLLEFIEEVKSELESLRDEVQERLDNMPEQLQECSSGEILQERIDNLDDIINEFDCLDLDFESEFTEEDDRDTMSDEEWEEQLDNEKEEWVANKIDEISSIDINFE